MTRFRPPLLPTLAVAATAGCSDGSGPGAPAVVDCEEVGPTSLSPGQMVLTDASQTGCIRLEAAGGDAEFVYLAYSAAGQESRNGTSGEYRLVGTSDAPPPVATGPTIRAAQVPSTAPQRFHDQLRVMGQDLARNRPPSRVSGPGAPAVRAAPPILGERRTFNVLRGADRSGTKPEDYVRVESTARYVGTRGAIFVDDAAPAEGGYTQSDLEAIGSLFDDHLYPISVNAFGSETDVNGDGVILVLLTNRVTRLAGCVDGQVVVGLFFAVDLLQDMVGSNKAEIFYGLTPDEKCGVTRERAIELLPSVFIHELQHMISYGQHVIRRDGEAEDTWLDEGLSGLAEELGARLVPDERCLDQDCLTQFHSNNLVNAYDYLAQVENAYLIGPRRPPLPLTQYGASWLFVRWLLDHFAAQPVLGTDLTRALVQTRRTGAENVAAAAGTAFDRLIGEWQLANYLEGRADLGVLTVGTRFGYVSWSLRDVFASFNQEDPSEFPSAYPLHPDVFTGDAYVREGVLRAGSGQHLVVRQSAGGAVLDLRLTGPDGANALSPGVVPRTAVLRLR